MIVNLFKLKWCNDDVIEFLSALPDGFHYRMITHQNDIVHSDRITFRERWVKCLILEYGDTGYSTSWSVNERMSNTAALLCLSQFTDFINKHLPHKKQPKAPILRELQRQSMMDLEGALRINNNMDGKSRNIAFVLNDYTHEERLPILEYLASTGPESVELSISINLANATLEQLSANANNILCMNVERN